MFTIFGIESGCLNLFKNLLKFMAEVLYGPYKPPSPEEELKEAIRICKGSGALFIILNFFNLTAFICGLFDIKTLAISIAVVGVFCMLPWREMMPAIKKISWCRYVFGIIGLCTTISLYIVMYFIVAETSPMGGLIFIIMSSVIFLLACLYILKLQ